MTEAEKPRYRDLAEEANLRASEEQRIAKLFAAGGILSSSDTATGMVNSQQALVNIGESITRADRAFELGCYIEAMSLRLQHMELWLRIFLFARRGTGKLFTKQDKRPFGQFSWSANKSDLTPN
jgi:hypothetical protein